MRKRDRSRRVCATASPLWTGELRPGCIRPDHPPSRLFLRATTVQRLNKSLSIFAPENWGGFDGLCHESKMPTTPAFIHPADVSFVALWTSSCGPPSSPCPQTPSRPSQCIAQAAREPLRQGLQRKIVQRARDHFGDMVGLDSRGTGATLAAHLWTPRSTTLSLSRFGPSPESSVMLARIPNATG